MTAIAEAIGMTLPGASSIPAPTPIITAWREPRPADRRDGMGTPDT